MWSWILGRISEAHELPALRHTFIECLGNVTNVNGRPTQTSPSDPRYIDYYGRPWAKNWERYFEQAEKVAAPIGGLVASSDAVSVPSAAFQSWVK